MYRVRDVMSHSVAYVTREATVRTAVELLRNHPLEVLPVLDGDEVVGLIEALALTRFDGEVPISEVMTSPAIMADADEPLPEAGRRMREAGVRQIPVLRQGQLVGLLSDRDLLSVWGQVEDSLTGLPVQHQLRRWVTGMLSSAREVAIIFLDLDGFGLINKRFGHVFGDLVLQRVADTVRGVIDPMRDYACRYAGDEFAIATLRQPAEAWALAEELRDAILRIPLNGSGEGLTVSIGIAGGRRHRSRPATHPAATLDDLLNQASTASTAAKELPTRVCQFRSSGDARPAPDPPGLPEATVPANAGSRPQLQGYRIGRGERGPEVTVILRSGSNTQQHRLPVDDAEPARVLADATVECLQIIALDPVILRLEEIYEYTTPRGLECVGATILLERPGEAAERLVGASAVRGDRNRAYINAVLDATNRRLLTRVNRDLRPGGGDFGRVAYRSPN